MDTEDSIFQERLECLLGEKLCSANLYTALGDGTVLCKIASKRPRESTEGIVKFKATPKDVAEKRENIQTFLSDCKSFGIEATFKPTDILLRRNLPIIISTVSCYIDNLSKNQIVSATAATTTTQTDSFIIEVPNKDKWDECASNNSEEPAAISKQMMLQQMSLSTKSFKKSNLLSDFFKEVSELNSGDSSSKAVCSCSSLSCSCSAQQSTPRSESNVGSIDQERKQKTRLNVINEIYETERAFVSDLEICVNKYLRPVTDAGILTDEERESIFCNIADVWVVNRKLLKDLDTRRLRTRSATSTTGLATPPTPLNIADIFIHRGKDMIAPYTKYCCNHSSSLESMDKCQRKKKDFSLFLTKVQQTDKEVRSLDLASFLVKPVQRICRYSLLLKELLRNTPEDEEEHKNLVLAIEVMNGVVDKINLNKRGVENRSKISEIEKTFRNLMSNEEFILITSNRTFIREGRVLKMNVEKSKAERALFLFSDILVCSKEKKGSYSITGIFPLARLQIKDLPDIEVLQIVNAFELSLNTNQTKRYFLYTMELEEKRSWINDLRKAISSNSNVAISETQDTSEMSFDEHRLWLLSFKNKLIGGEGISIFANHRQLIKESEVSVSIFQQNPDLQPRQMFLFNDSLVLAKYDIFTKVAEDGTKKAKKKFTFKDFILFDQLIVVSILNIEGQFFLIKKEPKTKPLLIATEDKGKWIDCFSKLVSTTALQMYPSLESVYEELDDVFFEGSKIRKNSTTNRASLFAHEMTRSTQMGSPTQGSYVGGKGASNPKNYDTGPQRERDRLSKRLSVPSIKMLLTSGSSTSSSSSLILASSSSSLGITDDDNDDSSRNTTVKVVAPEASSITNEEKAERRKSLVKERGAKRGSIITKSSSTRDLKQHNHSKSK